MADSTKLPPVAGGLLKGKGLPDNLHRNGYALTADAIRVLGERLNFLLGCGQVLGWKVFDGSGIPHPAGTVPAFDVGSGIDGNYLASWYGKTSAVGMGTQANKGTVACFVVAHVGSAASAYWALEAEDGYTGAGTETSSKTFFQPGQPVAAGLTANDLSFGFCTMQVDSDTEYRFRLYAGGYQTVLAAVLFEIPAWYHYHGGLGNGLVDLSTVSAKADVTEAVIGELFQTSPAALWSYPKVLLHQSFWYDGGSNISQSTASASYLNVIDKTSTTVTSTTPGWSVDVSYSDRLDSSTVTATFCVKAYVTAGTGYVKLLDQAGATLATITVTTVTYSTDHSASVTLSGGTGTPTTKVDVHFKCDGGGTIHVTDFALILSN